MPNMQRRYLSPNSDPGNPGAGDPPAQQPPAQQPPAQQTADPETGFQRLLERHSDDAQRVAWLLYQENHEHRREARQLRDQVQQLQAQVPGDGSTVLSSDQAQTWTRYQELGTPDEITTLRNNLTALQRGQLLRDVAETHGYKVSVLQTLAGNNLTLELRPDESGQGRTAFVITGENQATPLPEYAEAHWRDFLPALQERPQGTPFPRQTPGSPPANTNPVQAELARRYQSQSKKE